MKVLSLFDGMSCGQIALRELGVECEYYASEVDKFAIHQTQLNFPNTVQLGDVRLVRGMDADLVIGGSPCQGFSFAGKQLNFDDPRSALFFEFVRVLDECKKINPNVKFLLENVKMKQEHQDVISKYLGVEPVMINSSLVSAQNRVRLYWANFPISQPEDKKISLIDVLDLSLSDCPVGIRVREKSKCVRVGGVNSPFGSKQEWDSPFQIISKSGKLKSQINKSGCLTGGAHSGGNHSDMDILHSPLSTRRYTIEECARLQTIPDWYKWDVSNSQIYKMLGNGWTVEVIKHILSDYSP
jgi:DNA-cytosine methyltransferase